jgi:hypothetical protein
MGRTGGRQPGPGGRTHTWFQFRLFHPHRLFQAEPTTTAVPNTNAPVTTVSNTREESYTGT